LSFAGKEVKSFLGEFFRAGMSYRTKKLKSLFNYFLKEDYYVQKIGLSNFSYLSTEPDGHCFG